MGILATELDEHLLTEGGDPLVTEGYEPPEPPGDEPIIGNVFHPDTVTTLEITTEYEHYDVSQPAVKTTLEITTEYEPPPSTGGQPNVITTFSLIITTEPMFPVYDTDGESELIYDTSGRADLELVPVPVPASIVYQDIDIIQVKMPKPTTLDQFGRPQG